MLLECFFALEFRWTPPFSLQVTHFRKSSGRRREREFGQMRSYSHSHIPSHCFFVAIKSSLCQFYSSVSQFLFLSIIFPFIFFCIPKNFAKIYINLNYSKPQKMANNSCENIDEFDSQFAQQFLKRHNELRKLHGSPSLELSDELCKLAKDWGTKIAQKQHVSFAQMCGIGENITVFPCEKGANQIVNYWYEENRKYEYETPGWQAGTNYFTQIVWKSTKELGVCCTKFDPKFLEKKENSAEKLPPMMVVVAFYRPAGNSNRSGQFELNVLKPQQENINGINK